LKDGSRALLLSASLAAIASVTVHSGTFRFLDIGISAYLQFKKRKVALLNQLLSLQLVSEEGGPKKCLIYA
jgi:hypothetical protein